jgi:hypothetical protein
VLIGAVFWITSLHDRPDFGGTKDRAPHGPGGISPEFAVETPGDHGRTS